MVNQPIKPKGIEGEEVQGPLLTVVPDPVPQRRQSDREFLDETEAVLATVTDPKVRAVMQELRDRLEKSMVDSVAGVLTQNAFREQAAALFDNARENGEKVSVVFFDVDKFKVVNDTHGHLAGDDVLRIVGGVLRTEARDYDVVGRNGGDELVCVFKEVGPRRANVIAERIRKTIESRKFDFEGTAFQVTLSSGVATMSDEDKTFSDLIGRADKALYRAKNGGRNQVVAA